MSQYKTTDFDNKRPADPNYPKATPPATAYNPITLPDLKYKNCIVAVGDYIVNREGEIMITTTSNAGYTTDFDKMVNEPAIRARYIGNTGDLMECANQMRKATPAEIRRAKRYHQQLVMELQ
jgi:hypothetical protein